MPKQARVALALLGLAAFEALIVDWAIRELTSK